MYNADGYSRAGSEFSFEIRKLAGIFDNLPKMDRILSEQFDIDEMKRMYLGKTYMTKVNSGLTVMKVEEIFIDDDTKMMFVRTEEIFLRYDCGYTYTYNDIVMMNDFLTALCNSGYHPVDHDELYGEFCMMMDREYTEVSYNIKKVANFAEE